MRRLAVIVLFVAACDSKESPSPTPSPSAAPPPPTDARNLPVAPEPEPAKPVPKDLTCQEVGEAWSDYLHNRNRKNKDWADIARDQQGDCERNDWPQPERQCWAAITDVASHQRCLDEFYKPRTAKHPSKPPPPDPEDAFFEQEESDG